MPIETLPLEDEQMMSKCDHETDPAFSQADQLEDAPFIIHVCTAHDMELMPNELEPEPEIDLTPGVCPVHDHPCEYGCEMECFLDGMTEEELATHEALAAVPTEGEK